jgi:hypothetical protein
MNGCQAIQKAIFSKQRASGSDTPERDIPVLVIVIPSHSGGCDAAPAAKDADPLPTRNPLRPGAFLLDPATSTTPRVSHREH